MKKKKIFASLASLAIIASLAGVASQALAAGQSTDNSGLAGMRNGNRKERPAELTEAQKTEMEAKLTAIKNAESAGDYSAWVTAVKAMDANSPLLKKVTSASEFQSYLENIKAREAKRTEMKTKADAVQAALSAGDYSAWVTAVKAIDEDAPELSKITADNFARYAEANRLRTQADSIFQELGVGGRIFGGEHKGPQGDRPDDFGQGFGRPAGEAPAND